MLKKDAIFKGAFITKEAPPDTKTGEAIAEALLKELTNINAAIEKNKKDTEQHYKDLTAHYDGVKAENAELKAAVEKHSKEYADLVTRQQALQQALDQVKKELDAPIVKGGRDLADSDTRAAIELQRRAYLHKGGDPDEFAPDMENLVPATLYRQAVKMLMKVGIESKQKIVRAMPEPVLKAFEASSLDSALFSPELLGIELNCIVECAELLDLYNSANVGKSTFMYPQVINYGAIGKYDCDAKCDAEYGPEGNITYKSGEVSDYRGVFCFQRKVLAEANYDLLNFMYNAAARSHRINRNTALMVGKGVNEPLGWLSANCYPTRSSAATEPTHVEIRQFLASVPVEYGAVTAVMHQNMFAYLVAKTDAVGRFLFGDGMLSYTPNDVRESIRISNCLPDPTADLTLGSTTDPFVTGSFLMAAGAWKQAYYAVNKRPLWIEQWEGKSTAWCVAYSFGAEDGGFVACCNAARIFKAGP